MRFDDGHLNDCNGEQEQVRVQALGGAGAGKPTSPVALGVRVMSPMLAHGTHDTAPSFRCRIATWPRGDEPQYTRKMFVACTNIAAVNPTQEVLS